MAAIRLTVPPEEVDPNVHPAKLEVRFTNERKAFAVIRKAVSERLHSNGAIPVTSITSAGWSTASFAVDPELNVPSEPRRPLPEQVSFHQDERPPTAPPITEALPALRIFGQSAQTFIVAEGPAGLYMIDQHAAHERVLFDDLMRSHAAPPAQPLLQPVQLELTPKQMEALEVHAAEMSALSFAVDPFGENWCVVRAVPAIGRGPLEADAVLDVLDTLEGGASPQDVARQVFEIVACKAAVKAGQSLTMTEMRELIGGLERTEHPRTCPHGRPTTIHISLEKLAREFGRR